MCWKSRGFGFPSSYDVTEPREAPLIPRDLVFEISARMRSDGTVIEPVSEEEVVAVSARLRERGVDAVAVMLLNSYRDPSLEIAVATGCAGIAWRSRLQNPVWYGPRFANMSAVWWRGSTLTFIR